MKLLYLIAFFFASVSISKAQIDTLSDETETTAPEFPGGAIALNEYISKNLIYPKRARKKRIEGKVFVQFIVEEDGTLNSIRISKKLCKECDKEVMRLMKKIQRWIPATENRVPIENWMIVPVELTLKEEN